MENAGIIRGDTDVPTALTDLQHGATIRIARNAIQDELVELVADTLIPYEHDNTGSIVTISGTRSYSFPSDFVRFFGQPQLYYADGNYHLYEYPGGEQALQQVVGTYLTDSGAPMHWYFDLTTTKKIAFWPVPDDARTFTYHYEQDVSVTAAADTLPFHNEMEAQAFCRLAGRRFKMIFEGMDTSMIQNDPERNAARATLVALMVGKNPTKSWAPAYR